ncbi:mitochondrial chaperone [Podila verticillata]|uniref:ATPase AAA-type core domain-containing protein n=1 Tax=Podila verticillata NRRL 6337 TaxID=1069443 RepID=A0A086TIT3_9FUNG|nr:mitochondrial chaperone [Podila verticillata]KAI9234802.1 MAG: hypothetical protein BYD32DRAFT_464037 [Podila humilis]KFH61860.1 hypothetical protein MVEG_12289 [Podila verticillata NRRL 6337]
MEDANAALIKRKAGKGSEGENNITLLGILNSFDGITAQEGSVVFMTTNRIQKLDPALICAGHCNQKLLFGYADEHQIWAPQKPQSSVQSSKNIKEADAAASDSITAGAGPAGSDNESKAHFVSQPKQSRASGKQKATKNSTKHKAKSDDNTDPKKPELPNKLPKPPARRA